MLGDTLRLTEPGTIIAGRFRLVELLGRGGMGAVWKAEHLTLKSPVAVKIIHADDAFGEAQVARFMREAQSAASLRSPHVVQILDHGVDRGLPWIAMELLEGEPLSARIARRGKLSAEETARIVTQIARAVQRAHDAGVIHRDLKPDNVFLVQNDDDEIAKVLDFGIAKARKLELADDGLSTRTGAMVGTPFYMSPEQLRGQKTIDHRTDIWALGVIAYECLLGQRPFVSDTLGELVLVVCTKAAPVPSEAGQVPRGFDAWFARATAKEPGDRFESAREAARELAELAGTIVAAPSAHTASTGATTAPPPIPTAHSLAHTTTTATVTRRRSLAIGGVAIALVGALAYASVRSMTPKPEPVPSGEISGTAAPSQAPAAPPPPVEVAPTVASEAPSAAPPPSASTPAPPRHRDAPARAPAPAAAPKAAPIAEPEPPVAPAPKPSAEVGVGF